MTADGPTSLDCTRSIDATDGERMIATVAKRSRDEPPLDDSSVALALVRSEGVQMTKALAGDLHAFQR